MTTAGWHSSYAARRASLSRTPFRWETTPHGLLSSSDSRSSGSMRSDQDDGVDSVNAVSIASISALTLSTAAMIAGFTCSGVMDDHFGRSGASPEGFLPKDQDARGFSARVEDAMAIGRVGRVAARTRVGLEPRRRAATAVARRETIRTGWTTALRDII